MHKTDAGFQSGGGGCVNALRLVGIIAIVAIGAACWLFLFNFLVIVTHANLGFCKNAAEVVSPNRHCPAPLWYWLGNVSVPLLLAVAGIRKARAILNDANVESRK